MIKTNYFKKQIQKAKKNNFIQNVFILFSGSSIAQAIPLLSMIILSRLYPESSFGIFFLYSAIGMTLGSISTLKYEMAIVLPAKKDDAILIFVLGLIVTFLFAFFAEIIIVVFHDELIGLLGEKDIGLFLYLVPLSVLLLGISEVCFYFFNRNKQYKYISAGRIIKTSVTAVIHILFGYIGLLKIGLIIGLIVGQFSGFLYTLYLSLKHGNIRSGSARVTLRTLLSMGKKYKDFPTFYSFINILNRLSNHLPFFLLTKFFGIIYAGYYGLAHRTVSTPFSLIGKSFSQVFYQEANEHYNTTNRFYPYLRKTYFRLFKYGIIPFILLFVFIPVIIEFFFGADWEIAGKYAQAIMPWVFMGFVNAPSGFVIAILNVQKKIMFFDMAILVFRFLALYSGYILLNDAYYAILFFSLTGVVFNIIIINYLLFYSKKNT